MSDRLKALLERLTTLPSEMEHVVVYVRDLDVVTKAAQSSLIMLDAIADVNLDMHNVSNRPCRTCATVTKAVGRPFGCDFFRDYGRPAMGRTGPAKEEWLLRREVSDA